MNVCNKGAEYKYKNSDIKHFKSISRLKVTLKLNLNKFVVLQLNSNSIKSKFEPPIQNVKFDENLPKSQFLIKGLVILFV